MDPSLYRAASEGQVDGLRQHVDELGVQTTPNKNTALHVAAQFGHLQCVAVILELCPSLLKQRNNDDEIPLHFAARGGYHYIVKALIEHAKELKMGMEMEMGIVPFYKQSTFRGPVLTETALHMAVRNGHVEVVILLTREYPQLSNVANKAAETPLYLAAERGYDEIVFEILQTSVSPAYGGPGGRTALHAAVIFNPWLSEIAAKLLEWKPNLIKEKDEYGWTPLHYAARYQNFGAIEKMLQMDKSVAYAGNSNSNNFEATALHIAAAHGYLSIMDEILLHCPDCWEILNRKKQNILHTAVDFARENIVDYILQKPWSSHLINQKDYDGNTPLHILAASECETRGLWKHGSKLWEHERADLHAFNDRNMTPVDVKLSFGEVDFFSEPQRGGQRNIIANDKNNVAQWKQDCRELKIKFEEETRAQQEVERKIKHEVEMKIQLKKRAQSEAETKVRLEDKANSEAETKAQLEERTRREAETKARLEDRVKEIDVWVPRESWKVVEVVGMKEEA